MRRDDLVSQEQPRHLLNEVQHAHRQEQEPACEQLQLTPSSDIPDTFEMDAGAISKEIYSLQHVSVQSHIKARLGNLDRKISEPYKALPQSPTDHRHQPEQLHDDHSSHHDHHYDESEAEEFDEAPEYKLGTECRFEYVKLPMQITKWKFAEIGLIMYGYSVIPVATERFMDKKWRAVTPETDIHLNSRALIITFHSTEYLDTVMAVITTFPECLLHLLRLPALCKTIEHREWEISTELHEPVQILTPFFWSHDFLVMVVVFL
eukprot:gb/GEZJ01004033.1/.p1 GENE.gb/GEZJ01004033.1/~~gb/GEZJ01004033.1/.p1  ORF type:complete len:263 (+),score=29.35 gb/GEZJ01004033.1/:1092-1880(+)